SYCLYCFEFLNNSIEELSHSYNERLRMNEDIDTWVDSESQPESDASEDIEPIKECVDIDERLKKRIEEFIKDCSLDSI
ncbi:28323_t:CDS:2, partial [Racocetra persica]